MNGTTKGFVIGVAVGVIACHFYMKSSSAKG